MDNQPTDNTSTEQKKVPISSTRQRVITGIKIGAFLLGLLIVLVFSDPNHSVFPYDIAKDFPNFVAFICFLIAFGMTIWLVVLIVKELNNVLLQNHTKKTFRGLLALTLLPIIINTIVCCWYSYFYDHPFSSSVYNPWDVGPLSTLTILFFFFTIATLLLLFLFTYLIYYQDTKSIKTGLYFAFINTLISAFFLNFYFLVSCHGWVTVLYLVLIPIVVDVFSYFGGTKCGKHKLAWKISPNKTWEGFAIGASTALIVMVIFGILMWIPFWKVNYYYAYNPNLAPVQCVGYNIYGWQFYSYLFTNTTDSAGTLFKTGVWWAYYLPFTVALIFASLAGDLLFSIAKRKVNIKDFGNTLKGHGGITDRIDSWVFVFFVYCVISIFLSACITGLGDSSTIICSHFVDVMIP